MRQLEERVSGQVRVISDRLLPRECTPDSTIVRAACLARPAARLYGSPTMSDLVYFTDVPVIKCGPGQSQRSHQPDEYVCQQEILDGLSFYTSLVKSFALTAEGSE